MSFLRWLKFKLVRMGTLLIAALSFVGGAYSLFRFAEPLRLVGLGAGIVLGVAFLLISHYYKIKVENLFFIPDKKKKKLKAVESRSEQNKYEKEV